MENKRDKLFLLDTICKTFYPKLDKVARIKGRIHLFELHHTESILLDYYKKRD